jgi:cytochrome c oxidase subunit 3
MNKIHPHKFALWAAMAGIIMMFGAFTSAYIVRQAAGNWLEFKIPSLFFISTVMLLLSSVALHLSFRSFKRVNGTAHRLFLVLSFLLGLAFVVLQYQGWMVLYDMGIELTGNPSGSFLYLISGVHLVHVLGGLSAMVVALLHAFTLPCTPSPRRLLRFDLVIQYWHFVDALWIYLLIFLIVV